jgi:hypothetical protein
MQDADWPRHSNFAREERVHPSAEADVWISSWGRLGGDKRSAAGSPQRLLPDHRLDVRKINQPDQWQVV